MINIHVTAIRTETDFLLTCEHVDLRFENMQALEAHRFNLLKVFKQVFYTYSYERFN